MQNLVFGLVTGSILAVATVGFSMIRQTEGFLNISHGQYVALGAFAGLFFADSLGWPIWLAGTGAAVIVGLLGVFFGMIVFRPVRTKGALAQLFTGIGLAYVLYGLMIAGFGSRVRTYPVTFGQQFQVGGVRVTVGELLIVTIAAVSVLALHLFLTKTAGGTWIRAVASNVELAQIRGVPTNRVSSFVWFIAAGLAGLAGVLVGVIGSVNAEVGWHLILLVLAAAVLGGLGSIYGVIAAGLVLGLAMDLSALLIPTAFRTVVAFGALILVLVLRPEGLFAIKRRKQAA